jgi:hypothetical protein
MPCHRWVHRIFGACLPAFGGGAQTKAVWNMGAGSNLNAPLQNIGRADCES